MTILLHNDLNTKPVQRQFDKVLNNLQKEDFRSADVKKMAGTAYYRAKLDDTHRLLFQFGRYDGQMYLLVLEVILNHDYANSRFLRGAVVDESKLSPLLTPKDIQDTPLSIAHVNTQTGRFHVLDKILSFDAIQNDVYQMPLPLIMIGSAGSGKTALTLEKMKQLSGNILYITLSDFLIDNARQLYYGLGYANDAQNVAFLSFKTYMSTIQSFEGQEMTFKVFDEWINKYKSSHKIQNSYKIFEEFKGVITGSSIEKPFLSREDYLDLGIKQSIFLTHERPNIYELFLKYRAFLKEKGYYDMNIEAHKNSSRVTPQYDFVVIDEVQDLTNVQLSLILKSLKDKGQFVLCGDANQIVHPNFFSWTGLKNLFYQQHTTTQRDIVRILATNYRNTPEVTAIANQLLLVKNARFGSIDRESTYLVKANSAARGETVFYEDTPSVKKELNLNTCRSTKFAVLVMRPEDKAAARQHFDTPLIFSVQEAKGLEYDNIILYNIISNHEKAFKELTYGVTKQDVQSDLIYHRNRDKSDKSLEVYKFYINSLYVAVTRAMKNLYVIEKCQKHALLDLLDLTDFKKSVQMNDHTSSFDDWQKEADKLDKQGKQDQADAIRHAILSEQKLTKDIITFERLQTLKLEAFNPDVYHKKAKDQLFEFSAFYDDIFWMPALAKLKYKHAQQHEAQKAQKAFLRHALNDYYHDNLTALMPVFQKYGVEFRNSANLTPLMLATRAGAWQVADYLVANGADRAATDTFGRTPFQIALLCANSDPNYAKAPSMAKLYNLLKPKELTIKINGNICSCDDGDGLLFITNFMIANLRHRLTLQKKPKLCFYTAKEMMESLKPYHAASIPQYRRQKAYLSAILRKNDIGNQRADSWYSFIRIKRGEYYLNPTIEVEIAKDVWKNIYDLSGIDDLAEHEELYLRKLAEVLKELNNLISKTFMNESLSIANEETAQNDNGETTIETPSV